MNDRRDFTAYSTDEYGVRYKRALTLELDICHHMRQEISGNIGGTEWQLLKSKGEDLIGKCCDANVAKQVCNGKMRNLNGNLLSIQIGGLQNVFRIRQSVLVSYSPLKSEQTALFGEFSLKTARRTALRAFVPISGNVHEVSFYYTFDEQLSAQDGCMCISVEIDDVVYISNGIRYVDGDVHFLAYQYTPRGAQHYLVIEALDPIGYDVFKMRVLKAISAIGFCTSLYHYGPMYVFNSSTHRMIAYNGCVQEACSARYKMFSLNPYEYYSEEDLKPDIVKQIEPSLKPITRAQFEKLLSHLNNAEFCDLYYAYENVLTRMSGAPVNARLVVYSSCLEMARRWALSLSNQDGTKSAKGDMKALLTKKVRQEIDGSIKRILREHGGELSDSDVGVVQKRMGGLYTRPNKEQLKYAFSYFGIGLSKRDNAVLDMRNRILHGDNVIHSKFDPQHPGGLYMEESEQLCFDFHVLIWRLIMVSIGYNGKYRNVALLDRLFRQNRKGGGKPLARSVRGRTCKNST